MADEQYFEGFDEDELVVTLGDGSRWQLVHVGDITHVILWLPTARIAIKRDSLGNYWLQSLDTGDDKEIEVTHQG